MNLIQSNRTQLGQLEFVNRQNLNKARLLVYPVEVTYIS